MTKRVYVRTRGMSKYKIYSSTAHEERGVFEKKEISLTAITWIFSQKIHMIKVYLVGL